MNARSNAICRSNRKAVVSLIDDNNIIISQKDRNRLVLQEEKDQPSSIEKTIKPIFCISKSDQELGEKSRTNGEFSRIERRKLSEERVSSYDFSSNLLAKRGSVVHLAQLGRSSTRVIVSLASPCAEFPSSTRENGDLSPCFASCLLSVPSTSRNEKKQDQQSGRLDGKTLASTRERAGLRESEGGPREVNARSGVSDDDAVDRSGGGAPVSAAVSLIEGGDSLQQKKVFEFDSVVSSQSDFEQSDFRSDFLHPDMDAESGGGALFRR